jgi:hypothetical protein
MFAIIAVSVLASLLFGLLASVVIPSILDAARSQTFVLTPSRTFSSGRSIRSGNMYEFPEAQTFHRENWTLTFGRNAFYVIGPRSTLNVAHCFGASEWEAVQTSQRIVMLPAWGADAIQRLRTDVTRRNSERSRYLPSIVEAVKAQGKALHLRNDGTHGFTGVRRNRQYVAVRLGKLA